MDPALCVPLERDPRRDPVVIDRFAPVVHRLLVLGRGGDEEARVVAARPPGLGDPVGEIGEPVCGKPQAARGHDRAEGAGVARGRVEARQVLARVGVEQPRLLEALAHRADPVGEPALRDAEVPARFRVVEPGARRDERRVAVRGIDRATGENVRAAGELHRAGPSHHEHFDPAVRVPYDDDRGGGTGNDGRAWRVHARRTIHTATPQARQ